MKPLSPQECDKILIHKKISFSVTILLLRNKKQANFSLKKKSYPLSPRHLRSRCQYNCFNGDLKRSMLYDEISKIFWHSFCGRKKTVLNSGCFEILILNSPNLGHRIFPYFYFLFYSHLHLHNTYFSCVHFNSGWNNASFQKFAIHISWTVDTSKAQLLRHIRFFDYKFYI